MRHRYFAGLIVLALLGPAAPADSTELPSQYKTAAPIIDIPAAGLGTKSPVEKPATVSGTSDIIVAPIFANGSDGNVSFIRLANPVNTAATYSIKVVGTPSGNLYGTASYSVPAFASPQYSYSDVLAAAGVTGPQGADVGYSFYMHSTNAYSGYQHVIYNNSNKFFENMSLCEWGSSLNYSVINQVLTNIHTTQLANYPSTIFVHNYSAASATYTVNVYEAKTGSSKGTTQITVDPNSSYAVPFSYFQDQVHWTPSSSELHANLIFLAPNGGNFNIVVGQAIYNNALQAYVNMSQICSVNAGSNVQVVSSGLSKPLDLDGTIGKSCSFDFNCGIRNKCAKLTGSVSITGICTYGCSFSTDCATGWQCAKASSYDIYGMCLPQ
jgi:hypothetical protein